MNCPRLREFIVFFQRSDIDGKFIDICQRRRERREALKQSCPPAASKQALSALTRAEVPGQLAGTAPAHTSAQRCLEFHGQICSAREQFAELNLSWFSNIRSLAIGRKLTALLEAGVGPARAGGGAVRRRRGAGSAFQPPAPLQTERSFCGSVGRNYAFNFCVGTQKSGKRR